MWRNTDGGGRNLKFRRRLRASGLPRRSADLRHRRDIDSARLEDVQAKSDAGGRKGCTHNLASRSEVC